MRRLLAVAVAVVGGAAPGRAQGVDVTVPSAYATSEAPGVEFWALAPFDTRRQVLIDGSHCIRLANSLLTAISVRRNMGAPDTLQGGMVNVHMWLSHAPAGVLADAPSATFATNRGGDHQRVFQGQLKLPDCPPAVSTPAPWSAPWAVTLPFSRPFSYRGGTLCVETETRQTSLIHEPWWTVDAVVTDPVGFAQRRGTSCIRSLRGQPAGAEASSLALGASAMFWLRGASGATAATCLLGVSDTHWGALRLPFDLTAYGAPGCLLHNDVLLAQTVVVPRLQRGGRVVVLELPVPTQPALAGASLFAQWLVPDASSPLRAAFSNGVRATLGAPPAPLGFGWVESADLEAGRGRVLAGRMPVFGFSRGS